MKTISSLFLEAYNNQTNGFAKIIKAEGNVLLGYIGNFGYSIWEKRGDALQNIGGLKNSLQIADAEFEMRKDQTSFLSFEEKIKLIEDKKIVDFLIERRDKLKFQKHSFGFTAINAKHLYELLDSLPIKHLIEGAEKTIAYEKSLEI